MVSIRIHTRNAPATARTLRHAGAGFVQVCLNYADRHPRDRGTAGSVVVTCDYATDEAGLARTCAKALGRGVVAA